MRLDELFRNLGYIAGTIGTQMREACEGVPLDELDLTGPAPRKVAHCGPAQVVLSEGDVFRVDVDTDGQVGLDAAAGDFMQLEHDAFIDAARDALIGKRRVRKAVA